MNWRCSRRRLIQFLGVSGVMTTTTGCLSPGSLDDYALVASTGLEPSSTEPYDPPYLWSHVSYPRLNSWASASNLCDTTLGTGLVNRRRSPSRVTELPSRLRTLGRVPGLGNLGSVRR
jgi:hypothetical protein